MVDINFLAGQASIWVQPSGPNTQPQYLGSHGIKDIDEKLGDIKLLFQPDPSASGKFIVKNSFQGVPDPVKATIETDVRKLADYLETLKFQTPIFIHKVVTGRRDDFTNFDRSFILRQAKLTDRKTSDIAVRDPGSEGESTQSFEFAALELLRVYNFTDNRITSAELADATVLAVGGEDREENGIVARMNFGDIIVVACKAGTGVKANVYIARSGGALVAAVAQPFANDQHIAGAQIFKVGRNVFRIIVGLGITVVGVPAKVAYSDDYGATWTTTTVGATNAEFIANTNALEAIDARTIWAGTNLGNIYFSNDGGVTFSKQTGSVLPAAIAAISFYDSLYGYAVLTNGAVYKTSDGGNTWGAVTVSGSAAATDISANTRFLVYVSGTDGLYYTTDGGSTFFKRNANAVAAMDFKNELEGLAVGSAASGLVYQTIDGGYTWNALPLVSNSGLTDVKYINSRLGYFAGKVNSATMFFGNLVPSA